MGASLPETIEVRPLVFCSANIKEKPSVRTDAENTAFSDYIRHSIMDGCIVGVSWLLCYVYSIIYLLHSVMYI